MKKLIALAIISVVCAGLFLWFSKQGSPVASEAKVLRIGTNANFPPYESIDKNGGLTGFDIDLGRIVAQELGRKAEFKEYDFDALILALKKGQVDIIMSGLSVTKSRQQEIAMVPYQGKPLTAVSLVFWEQPAPDIKTLEDVKRWSDESKLAVSVQAGHFLEGFLRGYDINVKTLAGPPEQILDIKYKKSLAAALDGTNAQNLVQNYADLKLLTFALPDEQWDLGYGIGIKKDQVELVEQVEAVIAKLKANGIIETLEKKWLQDSP